MTARYSYDIDEQSIGAYLKDIVDQVNDEQSTDILSSKHYDPQSYVSVLKQLVTVVNDNYSGDDIPIGDYDHTLVAEIIRRVGDKVSNGGGGGGDYVASAVHFDGTAFDVGSQVFISTTFPTLPAVTDFSFAGWVNAADISTFLFLFNQNFDNDGSIVPGLSISTGFNFSSDVLLYVRDPTGAGTERVLAGSNDEVYTTDVWHFVCASGQINLAQNSKVLQLLMDSVNIINHENDVDLGDAFSVELTGTVLTIPGWNGGEGVACDLADFQFWFDQAIDFSNPTNLGKFVSGGKPVDPAVAALAFGQQSILLSGDATSTGFQKNQGSFGDIFTLTGAVIDATTSPSD